MSKTGAAKKFDGDWTVARVMREMPTVKLRIRGKVVVGRIGGRQLDFPRVSELRPGDRESFEFAWETIVDCLNSGRALEV